ncbi:MAG TPA: winged helix-turn-helix transcriptional regulator [Actinomycetota bacterium]|nr:winged helix-turn-helix transcriptional regulator [Actinomycetota bacterium]
MTKRSYGQFCGLAKALDIVGERWTMLIVRDLALGPQRYTDLLAGLPGIGTGLLAQRLHALEEAGLARRGELPAPASVPVWELTDEGRELADALLPLSVWGAKRLGRRRRGELFRGDWLLRTLWANFSPDAARGVRDVYEFRVEGETVHVVVDDATMDVRRGPAPVPPDLVVTTDIATLLDVGVGRLDPREARASGRTIVDGPPEVLRRCMEILGPRRTEVAGSRPQRGR